MPRYIPSTEADRQEMLSAIGFSTMEDLFGDIPAVVRLDRKLNVPEALPELDLLRHMRQLAGSNAGTGEYACFLGAGTYDHYIPSVVGHILSRQEFYTSYTPYQPEISQGTLQAIFEYQTMVCELTGMDVSNASIYDGATALAEAVAMACQATGRPEVAVARSVHPEYRSVLKTYARFSGRRVVEVGCKDGRMDPGQLEKALTGNTAAVIVQNPNFFGGVEDLQAIAALAHANGSLAIACVDPVSLGLLKPPGECGFDIAAGEGQALGNALSFGGPYLGFLAAAKDLVRRMPGRIAGETVDRNGKRGFVLTLQAREQHIRREKANSNICSNQSLNALAATVYLSVLGKQGIRKVAELCTQKAHYAYEKLLETGQFQPVNHGAFFKEFVVKSTRPLQEVNRDLLSHKILGGLELEKFYPEMKNCWLLAVTEKRTREEIDRLVRVAAGMPLQEATNGSLQTDGGCSL